MAQFLQNVLALYYEPVVTIFVGLLLHRALQAILNFKTWYTGHYSGITITLRTLRTGTSTIFF
ncbi:hypothetical protein CCR75_006712 [Bremia lactucae]|uniref:Uncharacterized protein n=1 Tax=Bremia lactucae TaxID=4779 RepID=A0A976FF55_BRELC|nr:hypothetical protein CCR75_006712 [Bremia lactucae]